ncbi:MAG: type VI secretion system tube protein Hcp [Gemmatimonadaceae bacterium]|nr:type VI secretion system tube protein Hcp [Gemmatimonadaceae bacterium]
MPFDAYLKLAGVDGEATRKGFEKQMEIFSFSFGASNPSTIGTAGGGGGAGKVSISSFNIMKKNDKASAELFKHCCSGEHFDSATVTLNKSGGKESVDFLKYEFEKVFIDSIQWSGSSGGDDTPTESISLSYGKVTITYTGQSDKGGKAENIVASWNVQTNTP